MLKKTKSTKQNSQNKVNLPLKSPKNANNNVQGTIQKPSEIWNTDDILMLQRVMGNQAVGSFLKNENKTIQRKTNFALSESENRLTTFPNISSITMPQIQRVMDVASLTNARDALDPAPDVSSIESALTD